MVTLMTYPLTNELGNQVDFYHTLIIINAKDKVFSDLLK